MLCVRQCCHVRRQLTESWNVYSVCVCEKLSAVWTCTQTACRFCVDGEYMNECGEEISRPGLVSKLRQRYVVICSSSMMRRGLLSVPVCHVATKTHTVYIFFLPLCHVCHLCVHANVLCKCWGSISDKANCIIYLCKGSSCAHQDISC